MKRGGCIKRRTPLKAKRGLKRGGRLERSGWMERRKALAPINKVRKARLRARNFGAHAATIRALECWGCGHRPPSDPAHTIGRKMGGCGGDKRDLLPLCMDNPATGRVGCHTLLDTNEEAFTARTGRTREEARAAARELWEEHGLAGTR